MVARPPHAREICPSNKNSKRIIRKNLHRAPILVLSLGRDWPPADINPFCPWYIHPSKHAAWRGIRLWVVIFHVNQLTTSENESVGETDEESKDWIGWGGNERKTFPWDSKSTFLSPVQILLLLWLEIVKQCSTHRSLPVSILWCDNGNRRFL